MPSRKTCKLHSRPLLFWLLTASVIGTLVGFPGESIWAQTEAENARIDAAETARIELPFRVYAQWALDTFDTNQDGALSKSEMQQMRSPLLGDRFDSDEDQKLSFSEIVEAIRKPSSPKVDSRSTIPADNSTSPAPIAISPATSKNPTDPVIGVMAQLELQPEVIARRFLAASLKKNDTNGDGKLSGDEIRRTTWSTIPWQKSDTNNDNELSHDELLVRYRKLFETVAARTQANTADTSTTNPSGPARSSIVRKPRAANESTPQRLRVPQTATSQSKFGSFDSTTRDQNPVATKPRFEKASVEIEIYLIRIDDDQNLDDLERALAEAKSSNNYHQTIRTLTKQINTSGFDHLSFTALHKQTTSIQSGRSESMIVGASQTRQGKSYSRQSIDIGLLVKAKPEFSAEGVLLNLEIQKSDLIVKQATDSELPDNTIVEWQYDSQLLLKSGKPSVVRVNSTKQKWILVVVASDAR